MKMRFLLMIMFTFVLILTACNGDEAAPADSGEEADDTADTAEETSDEADESPDADEAPAISADELIDSAQEEWGGTDSYELNQVYMIEGNDMSESIRTITTHSDQNELKVEINRDDATVTHYIVDDSHHIYSGHEMEPQAEAPDIEGTTYGDLISQLDPYRSGEVEGTDEGYTLTMQVENMEDAENLLSGEMSGLLQEAEDITGEINLTFDEEYRYTGGEMTAVLVSGGEEIDLSSSMTIEDINNIPVIEKPNGM
ncbi:hypothetical protein [Salinicoccus halitifaciens]|uniref:Lipoprotein n=2 Tax=Salinicoccus halitifaciens TaxID=1073415 RepID=A0ABV2E6W5_9STAP|nr:hypothetical protein [Salinicoccus halitifaciens]